MDFLNYIAVHALYGAVACYILGKIWFPAFGERELARRPSERRRGKAAILFHPEFRAFLLLYIFGLGFDYLFTKTGIWRPYVFGFVTWLLFAVPFIRYAMISRLPLRTVQVHLGYTFLMFAIFTILTQLIRVYT